MALNAGELEVLITANTRELDQLKNKLDNVAKTSANTGASFLKMGAIIGGIALAATTAGNALGMIVGNAAKMESLNAEFSVMLGSSAKASELINKIKIMAAATPFETADLVQNTKTLIQFGVAEKDVMSTLSMLGDVAGTSKERLSSLSLVFGQIASAGKLQGQDLLQLINVGFNPLKEISDRTGESMDSLRTKMEKGQISFAMVKDSFKAATSAGGTFFKNMETQSQTFSGLTSTLSDNINMAATGIGTVMLPVLKDMTKEAINMTQGITDFINSAKGMKIIQSIVGDVYGGFLVLKESVSIIGQNAFSGLSEIFNTITKNFEDLFGSVDKTNIIFTVLAGVIQFVNSSIAVAVKIIKMIIQANFDWWNVLIKLGTAIKTFFIGAVNVISIAGKSMIDVFGSIITAAQKAGGIIPSIFEALKKGDFKPIQNQVNDTLTAIDNIGKTVAKGITDTGDATKKAIDEESLAVIEIGKSLKKYGIDIKDGIGEVIKKVIDEVKNAGGNIDELKTKLESTFGKGFNIATKTSNTVENNTVNANTGLLPSIPKQFEIKVILNTEAFTKSISSISNVIGELQNNFMDGFQNTFNNVSNSVKDFSKNTKDIIEKGYSEIEAKGIATFQAIADATQIMASATQNVIQVISGMMDNYFAGQIEALQNQHSAEIEAIDERLATEIELIQNNGMTKQELLNQEINNLLSAIAVETDADKKKSLQEQLNSKQKELAILDVTKKANDEKAAADKELAKKKYKEELEQFKVRQAMAIANVWINAAAGIVGAWASGMSWPSVSMVAGVAFAGVMTGVITALAGVQTALIASQAPPTPNFALGGIVPGSNYSGDNIQANVNSGEMILNQTQQKNMFDLISGNLGNKEQGNNQIIVYLDSDIIFNKMYERQRLTEARTF